MCSDEGATNDGDGGGAPSSPSRLDDTDLLLDYDPSGTLWGAEFGSPAPALGDACLPFTRGALTFGSGMGVKMTVTRLQQVESGGPYLILSVCGSKCLTCSFIEQGRVYVSPPTRPLACIGLWRRPA